MSLLNKAMNIVTNATEVENGVMLTMEEFLVLKQAIKIMYDFEYQDQDIDYDTEDEDTNDYSYWGYEDFQL